MLVATRHADLETAVGYFTRALFNFINIQSGVFRTLHIHARLRQEGLSQQVLHARMPEYLQIQQWLNEHDESNVITDTQFDMGIFLAINSTIDKVLYADLTPAIATSLEGNAFSDELANVLLGYFRR